MQSDKCLAEQGQGKLIKQVFGIPADKWKLEIVTTYKKGKDICIIVQAAFWGNGKRCPLYIIDWDFESEKHGYSAKSYIKVLDAQVRQFYTDDLVFIQDNASIYTAQTVKAWF